MTGRHRFAATAATGPGRGRLALRGGSRRRPVV